jgi:hypothetical protein
MMKKVKKKVRKKSRINEIKEKEFSEITFILNRNEKIRIRYESRDEDNDQNEES